MVELIARLSEAYGPPGAERVVRSIVEEESRPYADEIRTDVLGNLLVRKGSPEGPRIMISAHIDEIGLVVTYVDEKGFLRFHPAGGISPHVLLGQRVRFESGLVGAIGCEPVDDIKNVKMEVLYIDIGARNREEALAQVQPGDMCCWHRRLDQVGRRVIGKALDDRIGCAALLAALRRLDGKNIPNNVFFVFSVQEEVGLRGARTAAYGIKPALGLSVDVTGAGDTPAAKPLPMELGKGAAIKVKDSSLVCHPGVCRYLVELAKKHNIAYQMEVLPAGGTDAAAIQLSEAGVATGGLSIPTRYVHTPAEMADLDDVEALVALLVELVSAPLDLSYINSL